MKTITMLEFRRDARKVLRQLGLGREIMRLTYRGKPVATLSPIGSVAGTRPSPNDTFYRMSEMAVDAPSISNGEIDRTLYGQA